MKKRNITLLLSATMLLSASLLGCAGNANTNDSQALATSESEANEDKTSSDVSEASSEETSDSTSELAEENSEKDQATEEPAEVDEIDYMELYSPILDRFTNYIDTVKEDDSAIFDYEFAGIYGLNEACMPYDVVEALKNVGYIIKDYSGDGIKELVVFENYTNPDGETESNSIITLYTLKDSKPYLTLEGWARNSYSPLNNGNFFHFGSGGAAYTCVGELSLTKDGRDIEWKDFYYTYEKEDISENYGSFEDYGLYRNTTGIWDRDAGEYIDEPDQIDKYWDPLSEKIVNFESSDTLYDYMNSDYYHPNAISQNEDECLMEVSFADDYKGDLSKLETYILDDGEYTTQIVIKALSSVNSLAFLGLEYEDVDEDGNITFSKIYKDDKGHMDEGEEILLQICFVGSIPNNGISYTDETGLTHFFSIDESGYDGSLFFTTIK